MKKYISIIKLAVLCFALTNSACNEDYINPLNTEYNNPDISQGKKRKVLYIILDGVNGNVLRELGVSTISKMTQSSLYSYDALVDAQSNVPDDLLGWSNLLTGKNPQNHGAVGNGTEPNLDVNPTILAKAKKSSVYASSNLFFEAFGEQADESQFNADEDALIEKAKKDVNSLDNDLFVVELNSAKQAAQNGGYKISNSTYTDAIINLDNQIGVLKEAVESRDSYLKEDWMIVVTSNIGGISTVTLDNNHFLDESKNIFTMYYSPKFLNKELSAPSNFNFISQGLKFLYPATNPSLLTLNSTDKFSIEIPTSTIGSGTTYQFKVKMTGNYTSSSWPTLISKNPVSGSSNTGLDVLTSSGSGAIQVKTKNANTVNITNPFGDGNWHTVTIVYERTSATQIKVRTYQDGVIGGTSTFNNSDNIIGASHPLRVGRNNATVSTTNGTPIGTFYDLKVYNTPLPETHILNTYCQTTLDQNSPYINNLKGYWLFNNVQSGNQIPNLRNPNDNTEKFTMSGATLPALESINEYVSVFCPPLSTEVFNVVPFACDNAFLIANWLGYDATYINSLNGKAWSFIYNTNKD